MSPNALGLAVRPVAPAAAPRSSSRAGRWPCSTSGSRCGGRSGSPSSIFFAMAAAMAVILHRQRRRCACRTASPCGCSSSCGCWPARFLVRANAPDTVPGGGLGRLAGFTVWAGWYVAVTIAMLYVANTARQVSTQRIVRLLGWMFVVTTAFGRARRAGPRRWSSSRRWSSCCRDDSCRPTSSAPSSTPRCPPRATSSATCSRAPRHPSPTPTPGATTSRSTSRSSCWAGSAGTPAGVARSARWSCWRPIFPITFSLNRGLWLSLALAAVYAAVRLAVNGRGRALQVLVAAVLVGGHRLRVLAALRHAAPAGRDAAQQRPPRRHGRDGRLGHRRGIARSSATAPPARCRAASTRWPAGRPSSAASAQPHRSGTQGFMWRLVLTTGFVRHRTVPVVLRAAVPAPGPRARIRWTSRRARCCWSSVLCFFVYDSLGSAMFTSMIAIGLMARSDQAEAEVVSP